MQAQAKVATVYAEALLELAKQENKVELLGQQLQEFSNLLFADKMAVKFFSSPIVSSQDKVQILESTLRNKAGADVHLLYFLCVLAKRSRFTELPLIVEFFNKEMDRFIGRRRVKVCSAYTLGEEEKKQLSLSLEKYFKKKISLTNSVHPELISGLVLYSDDLIVDTSIQGRLKRLQAAFLKHRIAGENFYEN